MLGTVSLGVSLPINLKVELRFPLERAIAMLRMGKIAGMALNPNDLRKSTIAVSDEVRSGFGTWLCRLL
jgi:hypothetical protein